MKDQTHRLLDLLAQEGRSLHALLTRLTLDPHAAEDLMQDLFLRLASNPAFAAAGNPAAYARQSAIHLALDWRRGRRPVSSGDTRSAEVPDRTLSAQETASQKEQWERILDAAADLPGQTREAFVLHYLQGAPYEDIAEHLGKTAHQVRALCHKAMETLRQQLSSPAPVPRQEVARAPH